MADIKRINRYSFVRKDGETGDEYSNSRWNDIFVTDIYDIDGTLYAVRTELIDHYSFDIGDDHGSWRTDVSFWVFPISESDANSRERAEELLEQRKREYAWKYAVDTLPPKEMRISDEAFGDFIISQLPRAIEHILVVQREDRLRQQGEVKPNAVGVTCMGEPFEKTIYSFDDEGICRAIGGDVSGYYIREADAVAEKAGLDRSLCFIVRSQVKHGTIHNRPMSCLLDRSIDGNVIICGSEEDRAVPLSEEETKAVMRVMLQILRMLCTLTLTVLTL